MTGNLAWHQCNKSHGNVAATLAGASCWMTLGILKLDTRWGLVASAKGAVIARPVTHVTIV
jgi:hypothetical protein